MTPEQRKAHLEVLHSLRFDDLPDAALLFLGDYLMSPAADAKVSCLLAEAARLHGKTRMGIACYEHVRHPEDDDAEAPSEGAAAGGRGRPALARHGRTVRLPNAWRGKIASGGDLYPARGNDRACRTVVVARLYFGPDSEGLGLIAQLMKAVVQHREHFGLKFLATDGDGAVLATRTVVPHRDDLCNINASIRCRGTRQRVDVHVEWA